MWLVLAALTLGADPDSADAKAAFDRMEQQVLKGKTLQVQMSASTGNDKETMLSVKGRLLVAPGDKLRLDAEGTVMGKAEKITMVSDGQKMKFSTSGNPAAEQETKKGTGKLAFSAFARFGVMAGLLMGTRQDPGEKEEFDPNKVFPLSGFKLGKKEAIAGVDTQAIEYQITPKGTKDPIMVTVWVATKTNLPVKRVSVIKDGPVTVTISETYDKTELDGKIEDKEFELPK